MKTIHILAIGFFIGFIGANMVGYFSLYELFAAFLDKPFFQTHGIWLIGSFFMFFMFATMFKAYGEMHKHMESRYNIIESLKEWGKVLAEESANIALHKFFYEQKYNKRK